MESKAILKYSRISSRKVRRVTKLIAGAKAGDALINLGFLPHRGGKIVAKVLKSAIANAEQKSCGSRIDENITYFRGSGSHNEENETPCHGQG